MSLLSLYQGSGVKAFETADIEDDGGTKTAASGALSDNIMQPVGQKVKWPPVPRIEYCR